MDEDAELLRRYAEEHSETAFATLLQRHLDLVHSAALRQVGGDRHLAEDVSQIVFTQLARRARSLTEVRSLEGWLYVTAHHASVSVVRTERRRKEREQKAQTMHDQPAQETPTGNEAADWTRLAPVLDAAMLELNEADRQAVLLRYFKGRSYGDVGQAMNLTEEAARKRVVRALDKLHGLLVSRGVSSTTAALGLTLSAHGSTAAPAGLAATLSGIVPAAVLPGAAAGPGSAIGTAAPILMSTSKVVAVLVVANLALLGVQLAPGRQDEPVRGAPRTQPAPVSPVRVAEVSPSAAPSVADWEQLEAALTSQKTRLQQEIATLTKKQADELFAALFSGNPNVPAAMARSMANFYRSISTGFNPTYGPFMETLNLEDVKMEEIRLELMLRRGGSMGIPTVVPGELAGLVTVPGTYERRAREERLRALLGEGDYARLVQYEEKLPARRAIAPALDYLASQGAILTTTTNEQLVRLREAVGFPPELLRDDVTPERVAAYRADSEPRIDRFVEEARQVLPPAQATLLKEYYVNARRQDELSRQEAQQAKKAKEARLAAPR